MTLQCLFFSVPEVVTKYSNFISFPLYLNGRRMNTLQVSRAAMDSLLLESIVILCWRQETKLLLLSLAVRGGLS